MRRVISLEDDTQDTLGDDEVVTDSTDSAPTDEPADPNTTTDADPGAGADADTTDDTSSEDTEEDETEEKKNAVIELADTSDLAVDELADMQKKQDDEDAKKKYEEDVKEAKFFTDELKVINGAFESYKLVCRGVKSNSGQEIATLKQIRRRVGLSNWAVSLEEHDAVLVHKDIALEGFKETAKHILNKIIQAIVRIFEYIKRFIRTYFSDNRALRDKLNKVHKAYEELLEVKGPELRRHLDAKGFDLSVYVPDRLNARAALTVDGDFLTEAVFKLYTESGNIHAKRKMELEELFGRSMEVVSLYELFTSDMSKEFAQFCQDAIAHIGDAAAGTLGVSKFEVTGSLLDGVHKVNMVNNYVRPSDKYLYVSDSYLADAYVMTEVAMDNQIQYLKDDLNYIGQWRMSIGYYPKEFANGAMPRLELDEIKHIYKLMLEVNDKLDHMRNDAEKYEALVTKFKHVVDKSNDAIRFISDDMDNNELLVKETVISLIKAVQAWLTSSTNTFDSCANYGKVLQFGWIKYMALLTIEDTRNTMDLNAHPK